MARQTSLITFTGRLGNVIGYCRKSKYFLRSMPEIVRQTSATRRAAQRFGIASRNGALIRQTFCDELDLYGDGTLVNRLNKALVHAGREMTALTGFQFNQCAGVDRFFAQMPLVDKDGVLHIPSQVLPQYKGVTALEVKVIAARISFGLLKVIDTDAAMVMLTPGEPFEGASLDVHVPGKGTLVIVMQVRALQGDTFSYNRNERAADIIGVLAPVAESVVTKNKMPGNDVFREWQSAVADAPHVNMTGLFIQRE